MCNGCAVVTVVPVSEMVYRSYVQRCGVELECRPFPAYNHRVQHSKNLKFKEHTLIMLISGPFGLGGSTKCDAHKLGGDLRAPIGCRTLAKRIHGSKKNNNN